MREQKVSVFLDGLGLPVWHRNMLYGARPKKIQGGLYMLGQILVVAIAGLVVWKYRDSLSEYVKGNAGPAREKVDGLLRTVQQTSETLLDQAKEQISSRLESAREKVARERPRQIEEDLPSSSYSTRPATTGPRARQLRDIAEL